MTDSVVRWLNELSSARAAEEFRKCCGSAWWCGQMVAARPFADREALKSAANDFFDNMSQDAWLEAFASHPKIGDLDSLRMRLAGNKQWSADEQAGVNRSDEQTLIGLAEGNRTYEQRFGYIFIICASGLSAQEMLAQLQSRLNHDAETELSVASNEQRKITQLRLDKLEISDSP